MRSYWSLTLSKAACVCSLLLAQVAYAQFSKPESERNPSQEKYLFPIKPGQPASLAGTMGELRSTHFHSGIDIRTNNEIGWPVFASRSGYISRISMSGNSYGNVIYITHPDGYTTLYAHLEKFKGALYDYVLKERYRRKSSEIDLYFREDQFPVKQGDTIALAGNTGASGGPHLHFDIRDANDHALDPLAFGFTEVKDVLPPLAQKIALKTMGIDSRVNDQFGRFEFYLTRVGNDFTFKVPILASGKIGIEVLAYDRVDISHFKTGINFIEVYVDGALQFCQTIERINLAETRNIYTLMDYKTMKNNGAKFYKLYLDDGTRQQFYTKSPGNGIITINPTKESVVKLILKDVDGNASTVSFTLRPSPPAKNILPLETSKPAPVYEFMENTFVLTAPPCDSNYATVYSNGKAITLPAAYASTRKATYLADMRALRPDSVQLCNQSVVTNIRDMVPSGREYKYYSNWVDITFPENALYDTLYLQTAKLLQPDSTELFSIGSVNVPLHKPVAISIKPSTPVIDTRQTAVYRKVGNGFAYASSTWANGRMNFYTRDLGDFVILRDTVPPAITRLSVNNVAVRFKIRDNLSGIASFEANINGKWLLMNFDAKTATLSSERENSRELLHGNFELIVTDNAGNKQVYKQTIP